MISNWTAYEGGEHREKFRKPRVTLNPHKELYLGVKAVDLIGRPKAVRLYFDVAASLIGVMPVKEGTENSFPLHKIGKYTYAFVRAATFCNNFGIRPDARIEFQDVRIDPDGMMVLDLKTARRLRK